MCMCVHCSKINTRRVPRYREDHKPADMSTEAWMTDNRWEESEEHMMTAWQRDEDDKELEIEDEDEEDEDEEENSYENSDDSDENSISSQLAIDGKSPNGGGKDDKPKHASRRDLFADRAARAAIMSIESGTTDCSVLYVRSVLVVILCENGVCERERHIQTQTYIETDRHRHRDGQRRRRWAHTQGECVCVCERDREIGEER